MRIYPLSTGFGISFLLEEPHGLFLIDSGSPGQENVVLKKMKSFGQKDLRLIWITHAHYDHYGSAAALREQTGAIIAVHPADASYLERGLSPLGFSRGRGAVLRMAQWLLIHIQPLPPTPPDDLIEDGGSLERFGLDATILHTPGHTPGHTCLLLSDGTAFAADLVARNPKPRLQDLLATDWAQLPGSLARLQSAHPKWVYSGHSNQPMPGDLLQQIRPET